MASIDWTAPGDSIKGNKNSFRKLKGTGSILAKSIESKNLKVVINKVKSTNTDSISYISIKQVS